MNKDSFDKAMKNKFPNTATDFDMEAAWNALESRRKGPKRRVFIWWFAFAGILLLSCIAWWLAGYKPYSPTAASMQTNSPKEQPAQDPQITLTKNNSRKSESENQTLRIKSESNTKRANRQSSPKPVIVDPTIPTTIENSALTKVHSIPEINQQDTTTPKDITAAVSTPPLSSSTRPNSSPIGKNLDLLPVTGLNLQTPDFKLPGFVPTAFSTPAEETKRNKEAKWWIGAFAGYGLSTVTRKGDDAYVVQRQEEEETLDMVQGGLELQRLLSGPWFIQTGIQYSQWTDARRRYLEDIGTQTDPNILLEQILYPDGTIENIYGPGDVIVIHITEEELYNRYRHIEIPVVLGAALPVGKNWQLNLSAGLAIGVLSTQSGAATINTGALPLEDLSYRKAGTLSSQGRVEWLYKNPNWSAGLTLTGLAGLNSLTIKDAPFTEKRGALGLGIVVRRAIQ